MCDRFGQAIALGIVLYDEQPSIGSGLLLRSRTTQVAQVLH
jgi:hypothetical protein